MSNSRRLLVLLPFLVFVLACQLVSRPIQQAKDAGATAAALATQAGEMVTAVKGYATEAQGFATDVAPLGTAMALPSEFPSDMFDPKSPPLTDWNGIPVMPQAIAGDESNGMYVYKVNVTVQDVQDFYAAQLPSLGWSQQFSMPASGEAALLLYSKDNQSLSITVTNLNGTVLVLLNMQ